MIRMHGLIVRDHCDLVSGSFRNLQDLDREDNVQCREGMVGWTEVERE